MVQATLASQVLVVPPFECAWLTGEDYLLRDGGCISFEVKGRPGVWGLRRGAPLPGRTLSPTLTPFAPQATTTSPSS